jgi:hypothetical protein
MMERDDHDSRKMSSLLLLTNERLDGETMRANEAERKASDLIKKFRDIILGRDLALQETARVREVGDALSVSHRWLIAYFFR